MDPNVPLAAYRDWLEQQPLSAHTRRAYRGRAKGFLEWLAEHPRTEDPLAAGPARDYAVRDYKRYLKIERGAKPSSVNLTLAALDHFYRFLGAGQPDVRREELPQEAPKALDPEEQRSFLRAVERCPSARDRALARLLFYTGLRLGEVAALQLDDVRISARKGLVIVRSGKGEAYREVPLMAEARVSVDEWLAERRERFPKATSVAVFLSRRGQPLAARTIDLVLRKLAADAGLELSAHTLRHTCLTNLVRRGNDLVLVAELAGHKRLETTRRYSLPTAADRAAAMEALKVEY